MWCFRQTVTLNLFMLLLLQWSLATHQDVVHSAEYYASAIRIPEIDINQLHSTASLHTSMQRAIKLINEVESMPTCAKFASSALMHSCSSLEGTIPHDEINLTVGSDLFIEEEVDIYAARLAVCELKGAAMEVPMHCLRFVPTERTAKKQGIRGFWSKNGPTEPTTTYQYYDEITFADLNKCRTALGSTPQTWTSYSNNRQNAVVLCRGMRSEIEKDQQIHLARVLSGVSTAATESLYDAGRKYEQVKAAFEEISKSIPLFHQALATANKEQMMAVQQFWSTVQADFNQTRELAKDLNRLILEGQDGAQVVVDSASSAAQQLDSMISEMSENQRHAIKMISTETQNLSTRLQSYGEEILLQAVLAKDHLAQFIHQVNYESFQRQNSFHDFVAWQNVQQEHTKMEWIELHNLTKSFKENLQETLSLAQWLSDINLEVIDWLESIRAHLLTVLASATFALLFGIVMFMTCLLRNASLTVKMVISGAFATCTTFLLFPKTMILVLLPIDHLRNINISRLNWTLPGAFLIGMGCSRWYRYLRWTSQGRPGCANFDLPLHSNTSRSKHFKTPKIRLLVNDPNYIASKLPIRATGPVSAATGGIWR